MGFSFINYLKFYSEVNQWILWLYKEVDSVYIQFSLPLYLLLQVKTMIELCLFLVYFFGKYNSNLNWQPNKTKQTILTRDQFPRDIPLKKISLYEYSLSFSPAVRSFCKTKIPNQEKKKKKKKQYQSMPISRNFMYSW